MNGNTLMTIANLICNNTGIENNELTIKKSSFNIGGHGTYKVNIGNLEVNKLNLKIDLYDNQYSTFVIIKCAPIGLEVISKAGYNMESAKYHILNILDVKNILMGLNTAASVVKVSEFLYKKFGNCLDYSKYVLKAISLYKIRKLDMRSIFYNSRRLLITTKAGDVKLYSGMICVAFGNKDNFMSRQITPEDKVVCAYMTLIGSEKIDTDNELNLLIKLYNSAKFMDMLG